MPSSHKPNFDENENKRKIWTRCNRSVQHTTVYRKHALRKVCNNKKRLTILIVIFCCVQPRCNVDRCDLCRIYFISLSGTCDFDAKQSLCSQSFKHKAFTQRGSTQHKTINKHLNCSFVCEIKCVHCVNCTSAHAHARNVTQGKHKSMVIGWALVQVIQ